MKRNKYLLFILLLLSSFCFAQSSAKYKVAITMDDMPLQGIGSFSQNEYQDIFNKIIDGIKGQNVPVTGFVNESKLNTNGEPDKSKVKLLENWLDEGLDLGNHTYAHKSANKVPLAEYEEDIVKGEKTLKELLSTRGKELKYFRHPFLQTGLSLGKRDSINAFLKERGYAIAFVTVDNSEWIFASAYETAYKKNDTAMMKKIGTEYIAYMKSKFEYYCGRCNLLFGRNIAHTLLVHANRLNSEYFGALCGMIKSLNYEFVSLGEALKDEAYKTEETFIRNAGISWIDRWALAKGMKKDFFAAEPRCPKHIMEYAGVDSE